MATYKNPTLYLTKDGKALSDKQIDLLKEYSCLTPDKAREKLYREWSDIISDIVSCIHAECEDAYGYYSIDDWEMWDCPKDPWGD